MSGRTRQRMIMGAALLLVLCMTTLLPAIHELFHLHRHHGCSVNSGDAHLHADALTCKLCDYLTSFLLGYKERQAVEPEVLDPAVILPCIPAQNYSKVLCKGNALRGPPANRT